MYIYIYIYIYMYICMYGSSSIIAAGGSTQAPPSEAEDEKARIIDVTITIG